MSVLAAIFGALVGLLFLGWAFRLVLGVLGFLFRRPRRYRWRANHGGARASIPPRNVPMKRGDHGAFWLAMLILVAITGALLWPWWRWPK